MGRIPQHIVDQIYNATDIVEVIGDYVTLKKRGANYWGLSPFANEKTPSFAVNPVKGIYKDFSSGKGGTVINFLMEVEGYTYVEALKHLARKYNIELEEEEVSPEQQKVRDKRQSLYIVNEFAARHFRQQLQEGEGRQIGFSYFKERGILEKTMEEFQLGYAPESWDGLTKAAEEAQYEQEYLLELGLVSRSEKNNKIYDRFRGRVMFPITNTVGKTVGFGGRILGNRKDVGKYINSSESEIYHKSQVLYGLYHARQHIRNADLCILTEGYMDVILLHQNGIKHSVASSGTALTLEQIRLIRRFSKNVLMIYDGDQAGIKAASRGIDLLLQEEMQARVLILPDQHDPDSYVREKGSQGFLDYIDEAAMSFVDFKMQVLQEGKDTRDPQVQANLIRGLAETVGRIQDMVQRQMYIRHVAQQVDITEALMTHAVEEARVAFGKQQQRERRRESPRREAQAPPGVPAPPAEVKELKTFEQLPLATQERELLRVMVNYHDQTFEDVPEGAPTEDEQGEKIEYEKVPILLFFAEELEDLSFENQTLERIKLAILKEYDTQGKVRIEAYLEDDDADIRKTISDLMISRHDISPNWRKHGAFVLDLDERLKRSVEGAVFHYKSRRVEQLLIECRDKIKAAQQAEDETEADKWLESYVYLNKLRQEIHGRLGIEGAISGRDARLNL